MTRPPELQAHINATAGELVPITDCQSCKERCGNHRLGCECGGPVKWLWMDRSGAVLECGVDFSPIDNIEEPEQ